VAVSAGQEEDVMSTINITPFTDVLLVLLIIFIILASVTKEPPLPDARNRERVNPSQIVVIVNKDNGVQIGSQIVPMTQLKDAFATLQEQTGHKFKDVIVKGDPKSNMGTILRVMDAAKSVNLTDFGLANHVEGTPSGSNQ
jgi:biopolymer transport protein TolR